MILDGEIVTCGHCGQRVIFLEDADGIAIDEDSETEHECNEDSDG